MAQYLVLVIDLRERDNPDVLSKVFAKKIVWKSTFYFLME